MFAVAHNVVRDRGPVVSVFRYGNTAFDSFFGSVAAGNSVTCQFNGQDSAGNWRLGHARYNADAKEMEIEWY